LNIKERKKKERKNERKKERKEIEQKSAEIVPFFDKN
jgi:hypothetical protein